MATQAPSAPSFDLSTCSVDYLVTRCAMAWTVPALDENGHFMSELTRRTGCDTSARAMVAAAFEIEQAERNAA